MKKKILLAVTMVLSLMLTGCSDFDYSASGKEAIIKGYKADPMPTDLVIPSEIDGNTVISIGPNSFTNQSGIRSIALPNTLEKIERGAFENCINLTSVVFPNSLTELSGFKGCSGLTSISLSSAVVNINAEAFMDCYALSSITFSPNTISIGERAFANCSSLKSIDFSGYKVTSIAADAFSGCTNIESLSLSKYFIDTYITSDTAPSEQYYKSLWDKMMDRNNYSKSTIPISLTKLIPGVKQITVDGVDYSIEEFDKLWRDCWIEKYSSPIEITST